MKKYQLIIFETNRNDGCMSLAKKFYPENYTEQDRRNELSKVKDKIGKKYNFNGKNITQPQQKDVEKNIEYPDGTYIKIQKENLLQEDHWYEKLPCDILLIDSQNPNIVIGHRMADCPIVIAEDKKKQVAAVSHCGAKQINREVPRWTVAALKKEINSKPEDIHIYIGSCIKKENYQYDRYPAWATNQEVWKECITNKGDIYYIDLIKAIKKQLAKEKIKIENIKESPIDTYTNKDYYSHTEEVRDKTKDIGQNFVGCFYQSIENKD